MNQELVHQLVVILVVKHILGKYCNVIKLSQIYFIFFLNSSLTASKQQFRSNWSNYTPSQLESSFVSNIHRLFSEKIDIFNSVEFSKVSIVTGIIKITLKVLNIF